MSTEICGTGNRGSVTQKWREVKTHRHSTAVLVNEL